MPLDILIIPFFKDHCLQDKVYFKNMSILGFFVVKPPPPNHDLTDDWKGYSIIISNMLMLDLLNLNK